jgi:hypothetical protein
VKCVASAVMSGLLDMVVSAQPVRFTRRSPHPEA